MNRGSFPELDTTAAWSLMRVVLRLVSAAQAASQATASAARASGPELCQ